MSDYTKELAKDVLHWYNIGFTESESTITLFLFNFKKMSVEPAVFSSWEDVLCEMLFTMEESNKDTFDEIGEHVWSAEEILYVKRLRKHKHHPILAINKLFRAFRDRCRIVDGIAYILRGVKE